MKTKQIVTVILAVAGLVWAVAIALDKLNHRGGEFEGFAQYESAADRLKRLRSEAAEQVQQRCVKEIGFVRLVSASVDTTSSNPNQWTAVAEIEIFSGGEIARKKLNLRGSQYSGEISFVDVAAAR